MAEGVLIEVRRCRADDAFGALVAVARKHGVPAFATAAALAILATEEPGATETPPEVITSTARHERAALVPPPPSSSC